MKQKVKIKTNNYKDEFVYSGLTGIIEKRSFVNRWHVFLDAKSIEAVQRYNAANKRKFAFYPFISKENLIFLNNGLQVE